MAASRLILYSCLSPLSFFALFCAGAEGKDIIAKNREKKEKEGQGGRAVAITQSSNMNFLKQ